MPQPRLLKYWHLVEQFRAQIEGGELAPGDRLPSIAEMKALGFSRPAMERVHQIIEGESLIQHQPGASTFVSDPAKKKRAATGILGVCGYGFGFSSQSAYLEYSDGRPARGGHSTRPRNMSSNCSCLTSILRAAGKKPTEVLLCDWSARETLRHVSTEIWCVSILVEIAGMASVIMDNYGGARAATEYLILQGHERIAYLHGHDQTVTSRRIASYCDALKNAGLKVQKGWMQKLEGEFDFGRFIEADHEQMGKWLRCEREYSLIPTGNWEVIPTERDLKWNLDITHRPAFLARDI